MERVLVVGTTSGIGRSVATTLHRAACAAECPGMETSRFNPQAALRLTRFVLPQMRARRAVTA
ncbi:MAG: hypothetical protein ACK4GW_14980 [Pseudorhodobacter sp.]